MKLAGDRVTMRVAVAPVVPSDLPQGISAAVLADEEIVGVYYARALDVPVEKRCADASAALTAAFEIASELTARRPRLRPRLA